MSPLEESERFLPFARIPQPNGENVRVARVPGLKRACSFELLEPFGLPAVSHEEEAEGVTHVRVLPVRREHTFEKLLALCVAARLPEQVREIHVGARKRGLEADRRETLTGLFSDRP